MSCKVGPIIIMAIISIMDMFPTITVILVNLNLHMGGEKVDSMAGVIDIKFHVGNLLR